MHKTELQHLKHNVHSVCGKDVVRVQADLDKKVYDYFFRHLVAYTHGARQSIINFMFQRLYEECQSRGIPEVWDEESGETLRQILNDLNFNEQRPTSTGRTDNTTVVGNAQSVSEGHDGLSAERSNQEVTYSSNITTNTDFGPAR